jgi:DNA-binding protein YbaB
MEGKKATAKKAGEVTFKDKGSPLIASLRLAMAKQSKRKFSATSEDNVVRVRVTGHHEIESIEIENSGLSKKKEAALILSIKEAANGAILKAQRAAKKDIVAGTKGSNRSEAKKRQEKIAAKEKR